MSFEAYRAAVSNTGTDNTYEELFNRAAVAAAAYRGTLRDRPVAPPPDLDALRTLAGRNTAGRRNTARSRFSIS